MADADWVAQTADRVLAAMEETRSTWQVWHVRAEAQRQVRAVDMGAEHANTLVDLVVDEVLERRPHPRRSCPVGDGRERHRLGYAASISGAADVHLWCKAAAGDRAGWRRETTAMRGLTLAWTEDGGQVLGLAPSAAAAAVLAEQTGIRSDTLAKLTWSLDHGELPDWAAAIGHRP